ncbi:MAG: Maf family nucleotide pyrophosphatase [Flavobacteriales bacterium]
MLASKSPRRQQLLQGLEIPFDVRILDVNEDFPEHLKGAEIPIYLSEVKAAAFRDQIADNELIITADTVVWIENEVLNKPGNREEAMAMLRKLSGKMHEVFTAVMLSTRDRQVGFCDVARVYFAELTEAEISHYVDHYQPFDKAGAYGVQELIGYIGIERLEGSYFTVMGLPVQKLYEKLKEF